jgi:methyl-accepting chemotaxis protein
MKRLRTTFFLFFVGLCFVIALVVGMMIYLQYRSYIKGSYTEVLENTAHSVERLFPEIKDIEALIAEGESSSELYFDLVRSINEINESYGFVFIYYIARFGDEFQFVFDTDDITLFGIEDPDSYLLKPWDDAPDEVMEAWTKKVFVITKEPYTDQWGTFISGFYPILNDSGHAVGILGLDLDVSYVQGLESRAIIFSGASLLIALLIATFISLRLASSIAKPINEVAVAAHTLAEMRFDIKTSKLRKDEIGVLQTALYHIRETLRQTMGNINDEQLGKQLNISRNLNGIIKRSTEELEIITAGIEVLEGKSKEENKSVQETTQSVKGIISSIEALNQAVESQSESIASSSELIEHMVKGIRDIEATMQEANQITETLGESSKKGRKTLEQLSEDLTRMSDRSAALENANKTIANIAAQTNILAMNAAIEAAHAGEAGKGFAVVSSEIRKLAVLANQESESISNEIKNMTGAISQVRQVSGITVESMNNIFVKLSEKSSSFANIKGTFEMQTVNSGQILDALDKIRNMAEEVGRDSGRIQNDSVVIGKAVNNLEAVSGEVGHSVSMAQQAGKQMASSFSMAKKITDGKIISRPEKN